MTFASGSGGNSALVWNEKTHILVDAGISARKITAAIRSAGIDQTEIDAVFITHGHSDHTSGLPVLLRKTAVRVHASGGTASEIAGLGTGISVDGFSPGSEIHVGSLTVKSFNTPHDSAQSTGFVISEEGNKKLAFVTDLGHITTEVREAVLGVNAVILEANHDLDMLRAGPYPWTLKRRVSGNFGHLSNAAAGEFARELTETGLSCLLLAHLSKTNNTPDKAYNTVMSAIGEDRERVTVKVAPADCCSEIFEI